jgi:hypothetical protein
MLLILSGPLTHHVEDAIARHSQGSHLLMLSRHNRLQAGESGLSLAQSGFMVLQSGRMSVTEELQVSKLISQGSAATWSSRGSLGGSSHWSRLQGQQGGCSLGLPSVTKWRRAREAARVLGRGLTGPRGASGQAINSNSNITLGRGRGKDFIQLHLHVVNQGVINSTRSSIAEQTAVLRRDTAANKPKDQLLGSTDTGHSLHIIFNGEVFKAAESFHQSIGVDSFMDGTDAILFLDAFSGTWVGLGVARKRLETNLALTRGSKTSGRGRGLVLHTESPLARCGIRLSHSNIHGGGDELHTMRQHTFARHSHRGGIQGTQLLGQPRITTNLSSWLAIQVRVHSSRPSLGSQEQGLILSWSFTAVKHKSNIIITNGHGEGRKLGNVRSGLNFLDFKVCTKVKPERSRSSILLAKRIKIINTSNGEIKGLITIDGGTRSRLLGRHGGRQQQKKREREITTE